MPFAPLRYCTVPGCKARVKSGRCAEHRSQARAEHDSRRGTRTERGYTNRWQRYRLRYLKANPLCKSCQKSGQFTPALIVDHIIPIDGEADVLFWPEWNHQPLCHACHNRKTVQDDPLTKSNRAAGYYYAEERRAAYARDWQFHQGKAGVKGD
ncbi:HNH endonuclease [Citrobacter sp. RHBSTW-00696]|uniref:HNH endonuclease n=1 Tax=Citrobacter sp. RHBSTW-00696 TaxID=2742662 RepID=UPI0015EA927E|nr:HNH endonuclease [Citrobacter sp. RHBSTW-00696]QLU52647.1 HNH endonuclease [Citrobacter sp. RHBSTW-00696]